MEREMKTGMRYVPGKQVTTVYHVDTVLAR